MRKETTKNTTLTYHNFSEYVSHAKNEVKQGMASTMGGNPEFYGDAETFEVAVARCYDGYNAKGIGAKRSELSEMLDYSKPLDTMKHCGESLDVATYISGDMRCWWAPDEDSARPPKRIHLHVSGVNPFWVTAEQFLNHGGAVAVLADAINAMGAESKITIGYGVGDYQFGNLFMACELKGYDENVDVPRIGASTHASFFRRVGFAHIENVRPNFNGEGESYGRAYANERRANMISNEEVAEWLRIDSDEVVIDLPNAENSLFKDTKSTAEWVEKQIEKINSSSSKYINLF